MPSLCCIGLLVVLHCTIALVFARDRQEKLSAEHATSWLSSFSRLDSGAIVLDSLE